MRPPSPAYVYLLRLASGRLYVGATTRPRTRWRDHLSGRACYTTRQDPPSEVLYIEAHASLASARAREAQLKGWSASKERALVAGDHARLHRLAARRTR